MPKPAIIVPDNRGIHNASEYGKRLEKAKAYRDVSTIIICPTRGMVPARVVQSWQGLMRPMNQKVVGPIFMIGMEVGEAYNQGIKMILDSPDLSKFKFILTIEEDNCPPPDGLIRLIESIDDYDGIGGLYWTKGPEGMPMCYGDPSVQPLNFVPLNPHPDRITPCNGVAQGFTLFRLEMFKDKRFEEGKWFETVQKWDPQKGGSAYTQDLNFCQKAVGLGYKFAVDARVKVGHYDYENDTMW